MDLSAKWSQGSQRLSSEFPGFPVLMEFRSQERKAPSFSLTQFETYKLISSPAGPAHGTRSICRAAGSAIPSFWQRGQALPCAQNCRRSAFVMWAFGHGGRLGAPRQCAHRRQRLRCPGRAGRGPRGERDSRAVNWTHLLSFRLHLTVGMYP